HKEGGEFFHDDYRTILVKILVAFRSFIAIIRFGLTGSSNDAFTSSTTSRKKRRSFTEFVGVGIEVPIRSSGNAPFRVRQIAPTQCCVLQKGSLESKLDSSVKNRQHALVRSACTVEPYSVP